ncbi:acyltransferase [Rubrobacter taiwanensis]|uniref:Acyltransferase n=1 Tax=Rubrobacter taiwanensis TaxID=185139 RepID=A0A4R1BR50_9ACTN|nr:acyltransferase family protein [Rubrobacter taiwanensis]TCJ20068.1 acyltransferase [Rubrobacter taiwanensis]
MSRRGGKIRGEVSGPGGTRLSYLPGLDGLRAFAVLAVLLYHAGLPWVPGGFLGVEIFFVISGYLITALLLAEWRERGRMDLKRFWLRRARRLLPALYLVLVATLAYAVVFLPEEVAGLRADALAALGYVTNWYLIFADESYFEAVGRPSLLKHLWSLAVEEQFYLLWPPLLLAGLALLRRWTLLCVLVVAASSAGLMAALYTPDADPSRLYYGTDTRAAGLLFGAALAFFWVPQNLRREPGRFAPLLLDAAGVAALGALVFFCLTLGEYDPLLYRGGFALVAFATASVIAVSVHPGTRLGSEVLELRPLRWVGVRSYGIYLWHWPVFMVTRPQLDVPLDGPPLLALQLAATLLLADLSYRFIETPVRRGALERAWRSLREAEGRRRWRLGALWAGGAAANVAVCALIGVAAVKAESPPPPEYLAQETIRAGETGGERAAREEPAGPATAVGDSVMLGAARTLEREAGDLRVLDAESGLQVGDAVEILRERRERGELGEVVVLHIGNNGPLSEEQFEEIMDILEGVSRVVFVNVKVPRPWESSNNRVIAEGTERHPNAVLVDWHAASADRPELFWDDGIHLRPEGQRLYAELIRDHLGPDYAGTGR